MKGVKCYHGGYEKIIVPSLEFGREDNDFGAGFYLTKDFDVARMWASRRRYSVVSTYCLDLSNLKVYVFNLDQEWFDFIRNNMMFENDGKYDDYDVLIGPSADDLKVEQILNILSADEQIVLKSEKALSQLTFVSSYQLQSDEKEMIRKQMVENRSELNKRMHENNPN